MDKNNSHHKDVKFPSNYPTNPLLSNRNAMRSFQQTYRDDPKFIMEEQKAKNSQGNFEED